MDSNASRKPVSQTGAAARATDPQPPAPGGQTPDPGSEQRISTEQWRKRFARNLDRLLKLVGLGRKDAAEVIGINYQLLRRLVTSGLSRTEDRRAADLVKIADYFTLADVEDLWRGDLIQTVLDPQLGLAFIEKFRDRLAEERERRLAEAQRPAVDELALLGRALGFPSPLPTSLKEPDAQKVAAILRSPKGDTFRKIIGDYYALVTRKKSPQRRAND